VSILTQEGKKWEEMEYHVEKISMDDIEMGRFQSRTRKIEEGLDDLAENIRLLGLINPITVYKRPDGKYDLIAGQRRFLATKEILGWETIPARILPSEPTEAEAKAISLSENIIRAPLADLDLKDSIMLLYTRCNASGPAISKTLGIPYGTVLSVIKYEGLPERLQKAVDEREVDVDLAKRATEATLLADGTIDGEKAARMASLMKTMMPEQQKAMAKSAKERPEATIDELAEEARRIPKTKRFMITLLMDEFGALSEYADSEGVHYREAAVRGLTKILKDLGFLS